MQMSISLLLEVPLMVVAEVEKLAIFLKLLHGYLHSILPEWKDES